MKSVQIGLTFLISSIWMCGCSSSPPLAQTEFDLAALEPKNIDEVQTILGAPSNDHVPDPVSGDTSYSKLWKKPNASLIVDYETTSRRVRFFYLATGTSERYSGGKFGDKDGLTETDIWTMAHLSSETPSGEAHLVPVRGEPGHFWGLKLTPPH